MKKTMLSLMLILGLLFTVFFASAAPELQTMADITLSGASASAEGNGVVINGATVTITKGGSYTLSGTLTDGQIVVDAGKHDVVELMLNGVTITSNSGAAIYAKRSETTIITLADGTVNTLRGAASCADADAAGEPNAVLYCKDDLLIRGTGALQVYGSCQNGVASKNSLVIESGTIAIEAGNNGILGKDSVSVLGGRVMITAGNDGMQADREDTGTILISGGEIQITSAHDGMQAQSTLVVTGGEVNILAGGGYASDGYIPGESYKALKSGGTVLIAGGTVYADSLDDAIHAAKSVTVSGGTLTLMSNDDGIHADGTLTIAGGRIDIAVCYEGLESAAISISGGDVSILSTDDGINAAVASVNQRSGERMQVTISGGVIRVNAYGDGIDSNGVVSMSGGELYISGPLSSSYGALDYDDSFSISGGLLAAAGSVGMAQTPGQNSSQPSVIVYFDQMQTAGSFYLLTDESGDVLLSVKPEKEFQCIVLSAPSLAPGGQYALYESADGTLNGAARLYDMTISGIITTVDGSD